MAIRSVYELYKPRRRWNWSVKRLVKNIIFVLFLLTLIAVFYLECCRAVDLVGQF